MKKIKRNALWIAMAILGVVAIFVLAMEDMSSWDIITSCFILMAIALIFIGQVNLSWNRNKLNLIPMEFVKEFNKLNEKEKDDVVWFIKRLRSLSKKIENELTFFRVANAALEENKNDGEIEIIKIEASKKLNVTNDEFEAVRKKMLFS